MKLNTSVITTGICALVSYLSVSGILAENPPGKFKAYHSSSPLLDVRRLLKSSGREETVINLNDHYTVQGNQTVKLHRIKDEFAVKFLSPLSSKEGVSTLQNILNGSAGMQTVLTGRLNDGNRVHVVRSGEAGEDARQKLCGDRAVAFVLPVYMDPDSRCRMVPSDELLVRVKEGADISKISAAIPGISLEVVEKAPNKRFHVYLLRVRGTKLFDPLEISRILARHPSIVWAEPNFIREVRKQGIPNDTLFGQQQGLHNTGQNGGTADADVDAPEAWEIGTGSSSVIIAIIDDGVNTTHTDLSIFNNPGESGGGKETNGLDDDGNGLIDDYRGWDFAGGDNNPNPVGFNGHGTACAGVAAAIGDNSYGVAGMARGCKVLPVKIFDDHPDGGSATSNFNIGKAISYAADFADVLSNSWGGGAVSSFINNAIDDAVNNGRNGMGSPVFFASGNYAGEWFQGQRLAVGDDFGAGTYTFRFIYMKDEIVTAGKDKAGIDDVCIVGSDGYTHVNSALGTNGRQDFEGSFPPSGWTLQSSHGQNWHVSTVDHFTGTAGNQSAFSGLIGNSQWTILNTPAVAIGSDDSLSFSFYISSEFLFDILYIEVYEGLTYLGYYGDVSGRFFVAPRVLYPASYKNSIAVGASTDSDRRADYSLYGKGLDFVAPSNGGWNHIVTTDPIGSTGYSSTEFAKDFGGTSSATPLAAGLGALMLSHNPDLVGAQVRALLRQSCEQIGGVTYTSGWNEFYGYGRVNAVNALNAASYIKGQFTGDMQVDLLWRLPSTGENVVWEMDGTQKVTSHNLQTLSGADWEIAGVHDFNRDSSTDIFFRNRSTGENKLWLLDELSFNSELLLPTLDVAWKPGGIAHFDSNGTPDVVWRNPVSGENQIWLLDGTNITSTIPLPVRSGASWNIVGTGDFNLDGSMDLVWRHQGSGANQIWYLDGTDFLSSGKMAAFDPAWLIVAVADFNHDGHADIVFRNKSTGANLVWFMKDRVKLLQKNLPKLARQWLSGGPR